MDREVREMIFAFAAQMAQKARSETKETNLGSGQVEDEIEAGDTTWDIRATYYQNSDIVAVAGKARVEIAAEGDIPEPIKAMITQNLIDTNLVFEFRLPGAWLAEENEVLPA